MAASREWVEKDYYAVLGVPKSASAGDIKKAYRKLAQKYHPDTAAGDATAEERFKEISSAYDVLGDEAKRREYDRIRDMASSGFRFGGGPGGGNVRFEDLGFDPSNLGDLFGDLFGQGGFAGRRGGTMRGADLAAEIEVGFEEAISGITVPLQFTAPGGSRQSLKVKVPAGVEDGARIRLAGRGEAGPPGSRPGDLYVTVRVRPHAFFGRKGANVTLTLPVTYPEAALGAEVPVPTLNGPVTLKVPAGTRSGRTFRVRGKGAPRKGGGAGDLLVTVQVEVPSRVNKEERQLLEQLRDVSRESPRAGLGIER